MYFSLFLTLLSLTLLKILIVDCTIYKPAAYIHVVTLCIQRHTLLVQYVQKVER